MKKIVCLVLALTVSISLCSCEKSKKIDTTAEESILTTASTIRPATTESTIPPTTAVQTAAEPSMEDVLAALTLENYPVVDGSTATIPLATSLIKALTGCTDAQAEESIAFNTTDPSYQAMSDGKSQLLLVYPPSQPTIDQLDVFHTMDMREIGLDALVFIVNKDNPVNSLTSDQIRGIYSGKITNWSEVGGDDLPIVAFQRPELSGSQTLMLNLMMKGTSLMEPTTETVSSTMEGLINDIAAYDNSANAIGYSVYYYAQNMYAQPNLKFISVDGVMPSNDTINSKEYGFTSPFYGVIPLEPTPEAKAILDWLQTKVGQQLLSDSGYVPIMNLG